jgi:hypothetical protein
MIFLEQSMVDPEVYQDKVLSVDLVYHQRALEDLQSWLNPS